MADQHDGLSGPCRYGMFNDTDGMTALILDHLGTAFDHLGAQAFVTFPLILLLQL